MVREKQLLEILEAEERKSLREEPEAAVAVRAKTPLEHVAGILQDASADVKLGNASGDLETALTAAYFGKQVSPDGQQDYLQRLLLAEAATYTINKQYDCRIGLQPLALRIAADVYQDVFTTLCPQTLLAERKARGTRAREPAQKPQQPAQPTIDTYLTPLEPALAAAHYLKAVQGFESAALRCEDRADLCAVAAAKAYHDLLPTKQGKELIMTEANNPVTDPASLFTYAVMVLHKEFFNHFDT